MDSNALAKLRAFVTELLANKNDMQGFGDSDSLLDSGRLDSLATTEIVAFLEQEFGADFYTIDFDPNRFDSIDKIAAMIGEIKAAA